MLVRALAQCLGEKLPDIPGGDQLRISFEADQGPELGEDPVGEAVVGRYLHLAARGGEFGKVQPQPIGQLFGGFVGERYPERRFGFDVFSPDQTGQPECHRRGLPGSGARRHPERLQREVDHSGLFGRRLRLVHDVNASLPSGHSGHTPRTRQLEQRGLGVAGHCSAEIPAAA